MKAIKILRNLFKRIITLVISTIVMAIPTELFIGVWFLLHPTTFWQKLLMIILGTIFLGWIQFYLFLLWLAVVASCFTRQREIRRNYQTENRIKQYLQGGNNEA